ncbi:MAG: hypothetical protein U0165_03520 [Polyangiaceae bacterium]
MGELEETDARARAKLHALAMDRVINHMSSTAWFVRETQIRPVVKVEHRHKVDLIIRAIEISLVRRAEASDPVSGSLKDALRNAAKKIRSTSAATVIAPTPLKPTKGAKKVKARRQREEFGPTGPSVAVGLPLKLRLTTKTVGQITNPRPSRIESAHPTEDGAPHFEGSSDVGQHASYFRRITGRFRWRRIDPEGA